MLRRIIISSFILLGLIPLISCKKQNECDCLKSYGYIVTDTRNLSSFNTLQSFDKIEVYYTQDTTATTCTAQVVTGKHLLANISTEVVDGVLQIKNHNMCNFVRGSHNEVTVYVTAPHVQYFIQDGVGNMYASNTIQEPNLDYNIRNSGDIHLVVNAGTVTGHLFGIGDIYLSGKSGKHLVNATGECFINANDLQTNYCFIVYKSTGEAHVNVNGELDAVLNYTGNIYYTGGASVVHKTATSSGDLIKN